MSTGDDPLAKRPANKEDYPTTRPSTQNKFNMKDLWRARNANETDRHSYMYDGPYKALRKPDGSIELNDFALHASPRAKGNRNPLDLPIYSDNMHLMKFEDEKDQWLRYYDPRGSDLIVERTPDVLYKAAHLNTIEHYVAADPDLSLPQTQRKINPKANGGGDRSAIGHLLFLRPQLKVLAEYSTRCDNSGSGACHEDMTPEEKKAFLGIAGYFADYKLGPELMTRFINPTGSMGDDRYNLGVNAFLGSIFQLVPLHMHYARATRYWDGDVADNQIGHMYASYCRPTAIEALTAPTRVGDKLVESFWKDMKKEGVINDKYFWDNFVSDFYEAARLIGLGARQWGFDKEIPDVEMQQKMERFYRHLFSAKGLDMVLENNGIDILTKTKEHVIARNLVCDADVREIAAYPAYLQSLIDRGITPLDAETALAARITSHKDILANWREHEDGCKLAATSRVPNAYLSFEKKHALEYLCSNNGKGQETVFSL